MRAFYFFQLLYKKYVSWDKIGLFIDIIDLKNINCYIGLINSNNLLISKFRNYKFYLKR